MKDLKKKNILIFIFLVSFSITNSAFIISPNIAKADENNKDPIKDDHSFNIISSFINSSFSQVIAEYDNPEEGNETGVDIMQSLDHYNYIYANNQEYEMVNFNNSHKKIEDSYGIELGLDTKTVIIDSGINPHPSLMYRKN